MQWIILNENFTKKIAIKTLVGQLVKLEYGLDHNSRPQISNYTTKI